MEQTITMETIIKMGADARMEVSKFTKDTFETLLKKYESIQESDMFIEDSVKKVLREQIKETINIIADKKSQIQMLEILDLIMKKD